MWQYTEKLLKQRQEIDLQRRAQFATFFLFVRQAIYFLHTFQTNTLIENSIIYLSIVL